MPEDRGDAHDAHDPDEAHDEDRDGTDGVRPAGEGAGRDGSDAPTAGASRDGGPDAGPEDDDAVFAELVAAFDRPVDLTDKAWPDREDLDLDLGLGLGTPGAGGLPDTGAGPGAGAATAGTDGRTADRGAGSGGGAGVGGGGLAGLTPRAPTTSRRGNGPRDWMLADDEDDDHFVPPEPPPVPRGSTPTRLGWAAVAAAPLLLIAVTVSGMDVGGWWAVLAGLLFVGGFATLVSRLKDDRDDEDDDPHHGAVV